ncbi:Trigger factor [Rickettsiales endosymbiont of Paramecium tredecaurelia]|uniref:trigger factor n=1 Tax=Candidatus Sarmatiella mevalonica TaxID=2770581 RepID=UPI00192315AF|nr:trigger factor [Candidatus Sarmatiella mevalonica]MBL3284459.1 Trigger factor [Candidatus Sarmatiella mevalonica]
MQVTELENTDTTLKIKVSFTSQELDSEVERQLQEITKTLKKPGFRPGKVPMSIVRKQYEPAVRQDSIQSKISSSVQDIAQERNLHLFASPEIRNVQQVGGLEFEVEYHVNPQIPHQLFSSIVLQFPTLKPSEDELNGFKTDWLHNVAQEYDHAEEGRSTQQFDKISLDFTGFIDGVEFDNGKAQDFALVLGSKSMIPGFEEQLMNRKQDEKGSFTVTFPIDYNAKNLRGKEAVFEFHVKDIQVPRYLQITDELLEKHNITLQELEVKLTDAIQKTSAAAIRDFKTLKLFDTLEEKLNFAVSQKLLDKEISKVKQSALQKDTRVDEQVASNEMDEEEMKRIALRRLRIAMLISRYASEHNVQITQQELVMTLFTQLSIKFGQEMALKLLDSLASNDALMQNVAYSALETKVIDIILDKEVKAEQLLFSNVQELRRFLTENSERNDAQK